MRIWSIKYLIALVVALNVSVCSTFAIGDYEQIISEDGKARAYFWEGVAFKESGALADARTSLEKAVKRDENCFIGLYLLGDIADANGDTEARDVYWAKLNALPDYDKEYRELVDIYYDGDYRKTIVVGEEFLDKHTDSVETIAVCHFIGRALYYQGEDMGRAWDVLNESFRYANLMPGTIPAFDGEEEIDKLMTFIDGPRP